MFIFRWIKHLFTLIGLITVVWWGMQVVKTDTATHQKVDKFLKSGIVQEGYKDLRAWTSELFKGVSHKLDEDVTKDEKEELDELFRKEILTEQQKPAQ